MSGKKTCPSIFYILLHTNNTILSEYSSYNLYFVLNSWFTSLIYFRLLLRFWAGPRHLRKDPQVPRTVHASNDHTPTWKHGTLSEVHEPSSQLAVAQCNHCATAHGTWRLDGDVQPGETERNTKNAPSFPPCIARTRSISASNGKPGTIFIQIQILQAWVKQTVVCLPYHPNKKKEKKDLKKSHRHL